MKKILDLAFGLFLSVFLASVWFYKMYNELGSGEVKIVYIVLIVYLLLFSLYIRKSNFLTQNVLALILPTLFWASELRNIHSIMSGSGNLIMNLFGFVVALIAIGQAFYFKTNE